MTLLLRTPLVPASPGPGAPFCRMPAASYWPSSTPKPEHALTAAGEYQDAAHCTGGRHRAGLDCRSCSHCADKKLRK